MRPWVKIFVSLGVFVALQQFCYHKTAGFREEKIAFDGTELSVSYPLLPTTRELLEQKFYFLGSGVQCYAFLGEDNTTVFKVFKHYHMWPSSRLLTKIAPKSSTIPARHTRMLSILESVRLAVEEYREETGILYAHLHRSEEFQKKITLVDKIGIAHEIDPNTTLFVLQRKGELVYPYIDRLMREKDTARAQQALSHLVYTIGARREKGLVNHDPIIHRNFGFIEGKAVEIDIGSLRKDPLVRTSSSYKKSFFYETLELKEWVEEKYPELLDSLNHEIAKVLKPSSSLCDSGDRR